MKKRILAFTMAVAMTATCVHWFGQPVTTVQAANTAVPTINYAQASGNSAVVKWDTLINDSSVFFKEDFENLGLDWPNGVADGVGMSNNGYYWDLYGNPRGNNDPVKNSLKIINGVGYGGSKGAQAIKTEPNGGWSYSWFNYLTEPAVPSDWSDYIIAEYKPLKVGKPAIIRFKAKGIGSLNVGLISEWSGNAYPYEPITWAETLEADEFKQRLINGTKIKINNPTGYTNDRVHVATAPCYSYDYNFDLSVGSIEKIDNIWYFVPHEWYSPWYGTAKPHQIVKEGVGICTRITKDSPIILGNYVNSSYAITEVSSNDWRNYSSNITIPDGKEIVDTGSYFRLHNVLQTTSTLSIDDVTVAYAPLSRIYRDGILVAQDYTTEFTDKSATDKAVPNAPTGFKNVTSGNRVALSWQAPADNGTSYTYTVSSVNENNEESSKSGAQTVNVTTGIDHYEIYEGSTLLGTTAATSYTLPNSVNPNKAAVIAVDKAGNKSQAATLSQDSTAPEVTYTLNTTDWVNDSVTIHVTASDKGYGVSHIMLPDGTRIEGSSASYKAMQNGICHFDIYDFSGNHTICDVEVANIDKEAPTMPSIKKVKKTFVLVEGTDSKSGISRHEFRLNQGEWKTWSKTMNLTSLDDGFYTIEVKAVDKLGNESDIYKKEFKITYQQEQEAMEAVDRAEETFDLKDYDDAKEKVEALDDGEVKDELSERLEMLDEMLGEARLLEELEEIKAGVSDEDISEEEFDSYVERFQAAKEEVEKVTDRVSKAQMNKLVDEIEAIIAAKKHHLTDKTFHLTASPQTEDNKVALDWNTEVNLLDYNYQIYSSKDGAKFQSMPAKDTVKVLEVYPNRVFLRAWVNQYDTLGKISCDSVSISAFNKNPEIAKDYDVIVFGFADSNGTKDLTKESAAVVKQCIQAGKGVLFGHDTLSSYLPKPNLCSLAPFLNLLTEGGPDYKVQTDAYIAQKGGITNYPYYVGNLGEAITVPSTHAAYQIPSGDVWVKFSKNDQFYLTTWNNCAMIQTGHNGGVTSETEQKLLLNTIYYLAQITDQTSWQDYMGQDTGKPSTPELTNIQTETENGDLSFDMSSQDTGTDYTYYIKATCTEDNQTMESNQASVTMLSNIKGYSIVLDDNKDTIPDDEIETADGHFTQQADFSHPFYVHVKAIDNARNGSEVTHYFYTDNKAPTTPSFAVENDTLKLMAGTDYGFGIEKHLYRVNDSDWTEWNGDISLLDFADGMYHYEVKAIDKAGHESESSQFDVTITYHQDRVNALLGRFQTLKESLESSDISQEEFENGLNAFDGLKTEAGNEEDIEDSLANAVTDMETILTNREAEAVSAGTRAVYYVRLAERYLKESYIEKAQQYIEELTASNYKRSLMDRLEAARTSIPEEEEE